MEETELSPATEKLCMFNIKINILLILSFFPFSDQNGWNKTMIIKILLFTAKLLKVL